MGRKNCVYQIPIPFKQKERRGNNRNQRSFLNWIDQLGQVKLPDLLKNTETEAESYSFRVKKALQGDICLMKLIYKLIRCEF